MQLGSTTINKVYLGSTNLGLIYLGSTIVFGSSGSWAITGGEEELTVTDQPTAPSSPSITGGEEQLTVTG